MGLGLVIPALQGAFIDTVHLTVSVFRLSGGSDEVVLGPSVSPARLVLLDPDLLKDAVSEATMVGKSSDLQPRL